MITLWELFEIGSIPVSNKNQYQCYILICALFSVTHSTSYFYNTFFKMHFLFCVFLLAVTLSCDQFADCKDEESAIVLFNARESFDVSAISIVGNMMKGRLVIGCRTLLVGFRKTRNWFRFKTVYRCFCCLRKSCEGEKVWLVVFFNN